MNKNMLIPGFILLKNLKQFNEKYGFTVILL